MTVQQGDAALTAVPVHIIGTSVPPPPREEYLIETSGYTLEPPDGSGPFRLVAEDPLRHRFFITSNQVTYVGTKQQMSSVQGNLSTSGTAGPGGRLPNTGNTGPYEFHGQNEVWMVAAANGLSVGVIVERKVPRGYA